MEIETKENEFKPLLERETVVADTQRVFSAQLELLHDVVNYGTNLIPRCFASSDKHLKDVIILGILLRQLVAMLDGFEVLMSSGAVHAAALQARAIFEASVYLAWILQGDAEKKAIYYYVHNLRRQHRWAKRLSPGSPEAASFAAEFGDFEALANPNTIEETKKNRAEIERFCRNQLLQKQTNHSPSMRNKTKIANRTGTYLLGCAVSTRW